MKEYLQKVIDKYFGENRNLYFSPADCINLGNHHLYYEDKGDRIELWLGTDEGNVPLKVCYDADTLEELIKMIIY